MRVKIVTISSKGRFTIPKALRTRLGMQPGLKVELWVEKGSMRARPLKPAPKPPAGRETVVEAVAPKKKVLGCRTSSVSHAGSGSTAGLSANRGGV